MAHDLIELVARANLVLAAAIVFVFLLRSPVRDWFGARVAYALWLIPPIAASMCFLPPRTLIVSAPAPSPAPSTALDAFSFAVPATPLLPNSPTPLLPTFDPQLVLAAIWIGVALVWLIVLALRQRRFVASLGELAPRDDLGPGVFAADAKGQGPALIGLLRPRIVTPADFDERFTEEERNIMLAHERAHLRQGDPLINAAAAVLQCLCWFNPFVHAGIRALRIDQELACDAFVLASSRAPRRSYAQALIKTHIARAPAPLGCAWPPISLDAMKERIAMLKRNLPSRTQTLLGASALALVGAFVCAAAWSAQPPNVVTSQSRADRNADADGDQIVAHAQNASVRIVQVDDDADDVDTDDVDTDDVDTDDVDTDADADTDVQVNPDPDIDVEVDDGEVALLGADGKPHRVIVRDAARRVAVVDAERIARAARLTDEERAEIRRAVEHARELSRRAREQGLTEQERAQIAREAERAGEIARAAAERVQLSQQERVRIAREAARARHAARAEVARAAAEAQAAARAEAHAATREARAHAGRTHRRAHDPDAAALGREAHALAARAMELAALSMDDEADAAARERAEAALEASAERIAELVARVRTQDERD